MKVVELKRVEQESKMMKEIVQEFRRAMKESEYKGQVLIKKFNREINSTIRYKLIDVKWPS